jgi:hypothetical protein
VVITSVKGLGYAHVEHGNCQQVQSIKELAAVDIDQ